MLEGDFCCQEQRDQSLLLPGAVPSPALLLPVPGGSRAPPWEALALPQAFPALFVFPCSELSNPGAVGRRKPRLRSGVPVGSLLPHLGCVGLCLLPLAAGWSRAPALCSLSPGPAAASPQRLALTPQPFLNHFSRAIPHCWGSAPSLQLPGALPAVSPPPAAVTGPWAPSRSGERSLAAGWLSTSGAVLLPCWDN